MSMSKFSFNGGDFGVIPEGTYTFGIYEVAYDEEFGRMEVKMVTSKGQKYTERFMLKGAGETVNEPAMNAFIYFAKVALNEYGGRDEFDEQELVAEYLHADEQPSAAPQEAAQTAAPEVQPQTEAAAEAEAANEKAAAPKKEKKKRSAAAGIPGSSPGLDADGGSPRTGSHVLFADCDRDGSFPPV